MTLAPLAKQLSALPHAEPSKADGKNQHRGIADIMDPNHQIDHVLGIFFNHLQEDYSLINIVDTVQDMVDASNEKMGMRFLDDMRTSSVRQAKSDRLFESMDNFNNDTNEDNAKKLQKAWDEYAHTNAHTIDSYEIEIDLATEEVRLFDYVRAAIVDSVVMAPEAAKPYQEDIDDVLGKLDDLITRRQNLIGSLISVSEGTIKHFESCRTFVKPKIPRL